MIHISVDLLNKNELLYSNEIDQNIWPIKYIIKAKIIRK